MKKPEEQPEEQRKNRRKNPAHDPNHIPQNPREWQRLQPEQRQAHIRKHLLHCAAKLRRTPSRYDWMCMRDEWPGFLPSMENAPHAFGVTSWADMIKLLGLPPIPTRPNIARANKRDYPEPRCTPVRIQDLPADFFRRTQPKIAT